MRQIEVPVLIVGGGGTGLSAAAFLTELGVDSLLIEKQAGTSILPKAHYFNQRTMEIYALNGVADAVYAKSAPRENSGKIVWMTSLGGDGELDRRVIAEVDIMGGGGVRDTYDAKGFTHPTHISQHGLEAILREVVQQRGARMLFQHRLESLMQDAAGVTATIKNLATDEVFEARSQYVLAADGGRTVGPQLGVQMCGQRGMADFITVWFAADLSSYIPDDRGVMHMFVHPEREQNGRYAGALLTLGPTYWDRRSEQWAAIWMTRLDDPDGKIGMHNAKEAVHRFFKFDAPLAVKHVTHWSLETVIADRFSQGRVIFIGDAAHRQTPGAGIGLNSGIQDAHNIAWKLALVLQGSAGPALLDTYETERRPVISRNVAWSLFAMGNMALPMLAMGLSPVLSKEANALEFGKLFQANDDGATRRARLAEIFRTQRVEYTAHDMEMGFSYACGALVDDGSEPAWRDPMGSEYRPTARPGSRLPHAWLDREGVKCSPHHLIPQGGFLLLTGADGARWCDAFAKVAKGLGIKMKSCRIGRGGDAIDPSGTWLQQCEISADGVILVRPDGHVGFRSRHMAIDPHAELLAALHAIVCK